MLTSSSPPSTSVDLLVRIAQLFAAVFLLGFTGCPQAGELNQGSYVQTDAGGREAIGSGESSGIPCAVEKVLRERCQSCHGASPKFGAPMPLVRYEDLLAESASGKKVYEEVLSRVHDEARPMPQSPAPRLTADELAAIDGWVAAGAPRGEACGAADAGAPGDDDSIGCTPDIHAKPTIKFNQPAIAGDTYMCYGFETPVDAKRHATAVRVNVDNDKIVHHVLVMQSDLPVPTVPFVCPQTSLLTWRLVYAWAPGAKAQIMPPEAGIPVDQLTHWVVQVHYSNAKALSGQTDESGFEMCTTDKLRKYDADMLAFGSTNFAIPPKSKVDISCTQPLLPPIHIIAGAPHMHGLGRSMSTTLKKRDGRTFDLGSNPSFDWNNQISYPVVSDAVVEPGDTVVSRCVWQNSTSLPVLWGERTEDEMCFSFTMYYPKIPAYSWLAPAAASVCVPTSE